MIHDLPALSGSDACDAPCGELPRVTRARERLLDRGPLLDLAAMFKVLGDPVRVQLIHLLAEDELCVCDLSALLGAGQSAVSNHLRMLRAAKLVQTRRQGKLIFYRLDSQCLARLLAVGLAHVGSAAVAGRTPV